MAVAGVGIWIARPLPGGMLTAGAPAAVTLLDRFGRELRTTRATDGSRAGWVAVADIDPDLIAAFVASEDRRFCRHYGVDPRAAARAAWINLRAGRVVSGGSTITMQVARMLHPVPRTFRGKVAQALWALRLERHLGKQAILEQYLNRVPLGQGAVGVDAAARALLRHQRRAREPGAGGPSRRHRPRAIGREPAARARRARGAAATRRSTGWSSYGYAAPAETRARAAGAGAGATPLPALPGAALHHPRAGMGGAGRCAAAGHLAHFHRPRPPDRAGARSGARGRVARRPRRAPRRGGRAGQSRPARSSPGSAPRISGPTPPARWTWC